MKARPFTRLSARAPLALGAVAAATLLAACEPVPPQSPANGLPLEGDWRVASIGGIATVDPNATRVSFTDSAVSGVLGCNQFSGTYTMAGNVITISPLAVTQMACGGKLDRQEQRGLDLMGQSMGVVARSANQMVLSGPAGQSFLLEKQAAPARK